MDRGRKPYDLGRCGRHRSRGTGRPAATAVTGRPAVPDQPGNPGASCMPAPTATRRIP